MSDCFDHEVDAFDSMEYDYHYGSPKYTSNFSYNRMYHHTKVLSKWRLIKKTEKAKLFSFMEETENEIKISEHWIPKKLIKREADELYIWSGYKFNNPVKVQIIQK